MAAGTRPTVNRSATNSAQAVAHLPFPRVAGVSLEEGAACCQGMLSTRLSCLTAGATPNTNSGPRQDQDHPPDPRGWCNLHQEGAGCGDEGPGPAPMLRCPAVYRKVLSSWWGERHPGGAGQSKTAGTTALAAQGNGLTLTHCGEGGKALLCPHPLVELEVHSSVQTPWKWKGSAWKQAAM